MSDIKEKIEQERDEAREVCSLDATSAECAAAWDAVEELQAAASHKKEQEPKSSLETYCDNHPEAAECRVYED